MIPTTPTAMVSRVFDGRYRIDELVGIGALSAVFSAYDPVEGRWVALRVFDHALGADDGFVDRLLDAVSQASLLTHPNIAQIYDWGFDEGPYIVSELCEGGSLAALLAQGNHLETSQALVMTLEAARALNYGHEQGVFHRNLHPRNILFTQDQQVRITDYGLAKVLADAPVSHARRAIEQVRYASPEQARGRPVGAATDLYSLALVVSEAVSAQAPPVADTVVGTLMERAESPAQLHEQLGELLPPLERCGRVDADERPEAEELAIALLAAAETLPRPEALPVAGIGDVEVSEDLLLELAGGQPGPTDPLSPVGALDVDPVSAASGDSVDPELGEASIGVDPQGDAAADALVDPESAIEPAGEDTSSTGDSAPELVLAQDTDLPVADVEVTVPGLTLVPDLAGSADPVLESDGPSSDEFDVSALGPLDELDGFSEDDLVDYRAPESDSLSEPAAAGLEDLDHAQPAFATATPGAGGTKLDVPEQVSAHRSALAYQELHDDADDRLPWWPLVVLALAVAALVAAGAYFFVLDDATNSASVPDLTGAQFDEVRDQLADRGWEVERLENRLDGAVAGSIISQSPAPGSELDDGEQLTVTVSLGNAMVEIPSDIVGLSVDQAASRLGSVGLALGDLNQEESEGLEAGLIIGLDEPTTQMPQGETVDLRVSSGPQARLVPGEVLGMTIGDATSLLVGLRLQAVEEPVFDPEAPVGTVLGMAPSPGTEVPADSAVTLLVSAGPEPVEMPDIIGLTLAEAREVIDELGLIFVDIEGTAGEDVIGSLPPIGAIVDVGTEVTIILADPSDDDDESSDEDDDS